MPGLRDQRFMFRSKKIIFQSDNKSYYGPVPWRVLTGTLTHDEITRQLDEMRERNIREVFLYANYGLEKPDFLSAEWFECVEFMIKEFAKRDMAFRIYDELSWSGGSAGGIICVEQQARNRATRKWNGGKLEPMDFILPEFYL